MKRDIARIEKLLANAKASRDLVRKEIADGASLQHVYDELGQHEQTFATRLKELKAFNAAEEKAEAKAKADAEAKAKAQ